MSHPLTSSGAVDPATADAVRRLARRAEDADGVPPLGEQTLLNLRDAGARVRHVVVRTAEGLAGYGQVDLGPAEPVSGSDGSAGAALPPDASAELVVDPTHRGRGVGTALLAAVLGADLGRPGGQPGRGVRVWAHGDLPAARALARSAGLVVVRELWRMARPLSPADARPPEPPPGVRLRPAVVGADDESWLDLNARAFADHPEQGRMTLADLRVRQGEPWFRAADLLLAERDGGLVASAWMKVEPGATSGELYALAVDPGTQGAGLGRWLTGVVVAHLAGLGLSEAVLYVEGDNAPAVRAYRRAGFERTHVDVQHARPGSRGALGDGSMAP